MNEVLLQALSASKDLGLLLAALLGIWKWGFEEGLRRKREIPSVQGQLSTSITPHSVNTVIVSIAGTWTTKSPARVEVDVEETCIRVYRIPADHSVGLLEVKPNALELVSHAQPFKNMKHLYFGPVNEHVYSSHFILEVNQRYLIRWKLYVLTDKFRRTREVIVDTEMPGSRACRVEALGEHEEADSPPGRVRASDTTQPRLAADA